MENQIESEREEIRLRKNKSDLKEQKAPENSSSKVPAILNFYMQSSVLENITQFQNKSSSPSHAS